MKYSEEQAKRKELYNQIQQTRGMFFPPFLNDLEIDVLNYLLVMLTPKH